MQSSKSATIAAAAGAIALVLLIAGAALANLRIATPFFGFRLFLLGLLLGLLTFCFGIYAIRRTGRKGGRSGRSRAWLGLGFGCVVVAALGTLIFTRGGLQPDFSKDWKELAYEGAFHPARFLQIQGREFSPINDVTTNLDEPPAFLAIAAESDLPAEHWEFSAGAVKAQRLAYPGVRTVYLGLDTTETYAVALKVARDFGWEIRSERPEKGEFEASAETGFFHFVDDISVHIEASERCVIPSHSRCRSSAVDIRSKSRDGESDIGANAERICAYRAQLLVETGLKPKERIKGCMRPGLFASP